MEIKLCALAPPHWEIKSIAEVCRRVTSGGTPSRRELSYYEGGVWPWVKTQELKDSWIDDTEEYITEDAVTTSSAKILPANSVLIAMYGATVGQLGILRRPMTCNQACCALIADPSKVDFRFLFFQLLQIRSELKSLATGAAQQNLSGVFIKSLCLPFPPIEEQRAIAHILATLDDKIELNRRMNATLEAMARALFQSWFVDFDPVRAKLDGGKPAGMDDETSALFPQHLLETDEGKLPINWRLIRVSDLCEVNGRTLGKNDKLKELEYIEISEVNQGNIGSIGYFKRGTEPSRARRRLRHGDTVLSTVRPDRGSYFLALNPPEHRIASTGFAVLSPKNIPWSFIYAAMTMPEVFEYLGQMADGGAYPAVRPEVIGDWKICIPDNLRIVEAFHRICAPFFERADLNRKCSNTLATLRDSLLPKLLSGEISVSSEEVNRVVNA